MMWWMMYSTTILDVLNNICFLTMSGFGIESFIGQCMSNLIEDESIWNTCQLDQDCPEWFECQNDWKIHMISNSIIAVISFFINVKKKRKKIGKKKKEKIINLFCFIYLVYICLLLTYCPYKKTIK